MYAVRVQRRSTKRKCRDMSGACLLPDISKTLPRTLLLGRNRYLQKNVDKRDSCDGILLDDEDIEDITVVGRGCKRASEALSAT